MDVCAELVYSHTGYGITGYFRLEVIVVRKTTENAASDCFWSNFSRTGYGTIKIFAHLSETIGLTKLLDMTSLAVSCQLQNATKYCARCVIPMRVA